MINKENNKIQSQSHNEKKEILEITEDITVGSLAKKMNVKVVDLISNLMKNGVYASINEKLDFETAEIVADDFGFELKKPQLREKMEEHTLKEDKISAGKKRPPVVAVMGHIDHGKTTLLDKILKANITEKETGGITQSFKAYQVDVKGETITFLDTPGHEVFHSMRKRGAYLTDLAVIVVAADDGVKPQTEETARFVKSVNVPVIVAINKIDKDEANVKKVKEQLSKIDLTPEDWGGKTICVPVSAKTGSGIDELLDMIILASNIEELKANPDLPARGFVIESCLDSKVGPLAVILIQNGTLKEGDCVSAGFSWGRVKRMENFLGKRIKKAAPSTPVTIIGLNKVPSVGSFLFTDATFADAKNRAYEYFKEDEKENIAKEALAGFAKTKEFAKKNKIKKMRLILKADTKGSLEAIIQILKTIECSEVEIFILEASVGNVTESDIKLARSSGAKIVGFNVKVDSSMKKFAKKENIDIKIYRIIYELIDDIKKELSFLLEPEIIRKDIGKLEVIAIFKSAKKFAKKAEMIIGARVDKGKIEKSSLLEVIRNEKQIGKGLVKTLQYNKRPVEEVRAGNNAGITYEGNVIIEKGDTLVSYKEEKKNRKI